MLYKGQITPRQIDRDYRRQVEIPIPGDGLGSLLNVMHAACRGLDYQTRGIGKKRIETGRDGVRFCFRAARTGRRPGDPCAPCAVLASLH